MSDTRIAFEPDDAITRTIDASLDAIRDVLDGSLLQAVTIVIYRKEDGHVRIEVGSNPADTVGILAAIKSAEVSMLDNLGELLSEQFKHGV